MLTLYFVRHGETDWNVSNRVQGQLDSKLTEKGINDVLNLRASLKDINWQAIYTSPSGRALHTVKLLTAQDQHITRDNRIKEMNLGMFEGMTWDDIKKHNPIQYDNYWHNPHLFSICSGENFNDVKKRVAYFLNSMNHQFTMGNILIITHGVIIKMIEVIVQNNDLDQLWATPHVNGASVTKVKIDPTDGHMRIEEK